MIIADGDVVFESREAIEARIKDVWARNGFDVSFESFSVAQRLVDTFVELLYTNQEDIRELYLKMSINASGADLDNFVQRLGITRLRIPMQSFAWSTVPSNISGSRFVYMRFPDGVKKSDRIRYNIPAHRPHIIDQTFEEFMKNGRVFLKNPYTDGEEVELVIEREINQVDISPNNVPVTVKTLFQHRAPAQAGREFTSMPDGFVQYRNIDNDWSAIEESDDALRSRIITQGLSLTGMVSMLNQIGTRASVDLVRLRGNRGEEDVFKIIMEEFEPSTENINAFWKICDAYLPINYDIFTPALANPAEVDVIEETGSNFEADYPNNPDNIAAQFTRPDNPLRSAAIFRSNRSLLYVSGLDDEFITMLNGATLPSTISYPAVWMALGTRFNSQIVANMRLSYNPIGITADPINRRQLRIEAREAGEETAVSSRETAERGLGWKVVRA